MKALSASTAALFAALTGLVVTPPASATFSGENGRIVFERNTGHLVLFTVRPNGKGLFRLTNPHGLVNTFAADWSRNGRWVAYQRLSEETRGYIFRIRRDGTHRQNLSKMSCTGTCSAEHLPAWSPDGTRIAYVREVNFSSRWRVYVKDADGTGAHQVVPSRPRARDYAPQWAPSGKRLVFARSDFRRGKSAVFTVRLDGTRLHRITPWSMDAGGSLDWSPNGRWILVQNHVSSDAPSTVWLMHPNGENRHPITTTAGGVTWESGSFSPDGQRIVVVQDASISVLSKRGDILQTITASAVDGDPDWGSRPN